MFAICLIPSFAFRVIGINFFNNRILQKSLTRVRHLLGKQIVHHPLPQGLLNDWAYFTPVSRSEADCLGFLEKAHPYSRKELTLFGSELGTLV